MKKIILYLSVLCFALFLVACNNTPPAQSENNTDQEETNNEDDVKENEDSKEEVEPTKEEEGLPSKDEEEEQVKTNAGEDELAAAFESYLNDVILLAPEETRIIEVYGSVSGENYQNDAIMYDALVNDVVPSYTEFVSTLEEIVPNNQEVRDLHDIYIEAATIQLGAFTVMISALEDQDYELVDLANQGLEEASALITTWQTEVQNLSSQTGVSLQ
nr:hypothetical protein [Lysinibacillus timonensis]